MLITPFSMSLCIFLAVCFQTAITQLEHVEITRKPYKILENIEAEEMMG